jgi:hypothetical protein
MDRLPTRRLCAICNEKPATKHVYSPIDLLLCIACFMQWLKTMPADAEVIQDNIINPTWEPNL